MLNIDVRRRVPIKGDGKYSLLGMLNIDVRRQRGTIDSFLCVC